MAQLVRRVRRSDGITTVQVKWRLAGRGSAWQSETFAAGTGAQNEARAEAFQADVEEAGNRWPVGWTPGVGRHRPEPDAQAPHEARAVVTMAEVAADYFRHQQTVRIARNKSSSARWSAGRRPGATTWSSRSATCR